MGLGDFPHEDLRPVLPDRSSVRGPGRAVDADHPPQPAPRLHHLLRDRRGSSRPVADAPHDQASGTGAGRRRPADAQPHRTTLPLPAHRGRQGPGRRHEGPGNLGRTLDGAGPRALGPGRRPALVGQLVPRPRAPARAPRGGPVPVPRSAQEGRRAVGRLRWGAVGGVPQGPGFRGGAVRPGRAGCARRVAPGPDRVGRRPPCRTDPGPWTQLPRPCPPDLEPPQRRRAREARAWLICEGCP